MNIYSIRVVLHNKPHDHADYDKLHKTLEKGKIYRYVNGLDDIFKKKGAWLLPLGEYLTYSTLTAKALRNAVRVIVNTVDKNNAVMVSAVIYTPDTMSWIGLKKVL